MGDGQVRLPKCIGCGEARPTWELLKFARAVDGSIFDGHLPVCGRCVRSCPTCGQPVPSEHLERVVDEIRAGGELSVRWFFAPCTDDDHERPARESFPRDPRLPVYGPEEPPVTSNRSQLLDGFRGVAINDYVTVDGEDGVGRVKYVKSTFGIGVVFTVGYPDGRKLHKRPGEVQVVPKPDLTDGSES
jgi:hypothetical protein